MSFDFQRLQVGKRSLRERFAAKPVMDKLRLLDAMRARAVTLRDAMPRGLARTHEQSPRYGKKS